MSTGPRILVTNDDGVDAPGLEVAIEIARAVSDDVFVVAPASNKSGVGHQFTFGVELEIERRDRNVWALEGTPTDCVVVGMTHLFSDHEPDIVLSGVNNGQNLGDIINCSGTIAGAREGAMQGALGVAMSQAVDYENGLDVDWDTALAHGATVLRALIAQPRRNGTYFNVNFPLGPADAVRGIKVVPHQRFERSPIAYYPSRNDGKFFIAIPNPPTELDPAADFHILHHERAITVTPLGLDQSDMAAADGLQTLCIGAFAGETEADRRAVDLKPGKGGEGDKARYEPDPPASAK